VPGALLPPSVYDVHVLQSAPDVVLAAAGGDTRQPPSNGIYRSVDAGVSWERSYAFSAATAGSLASAPDDERLIFAAGGLAVGVSTDGGVTWTNVYTQSTQLQSVWYVACGPRVGSARRVYAAGDRIWYSADGGQSWEEDPVDVDLSVGPPSDTYGQCARCFCIDPADPGTVYLARGGRELWRGRYPASGGPGAWTRLPVPPLPPPDPVRTASGTNFVVAHQAPDGRRYLVYSDRRTVHIALADPTSAADWTWLDASLHADPHGLAVTPGFAWAGTGHPAGRIAMVNDGGAVVSSDGAANWEFGTGLSTLGVVNAAVLPRPDRTPGLIIGTGDNNGFFSANGGLNWRTQDYHEGDNDCSFADPYQPNRLIVFAPRDRPGKTYLYTASAGQIPDGSWGTSDRQSIPGPPPVEIGVNNSRSPWNCDSSYFGLGYRPLVLTLAGQSPQPDGDFITIVVDRGKPGDGQASIAKLLRTTAMRKIQQPQDWITTDHADGPDVKAFQQGPDLPDPGIAVVQASGGHGYATFYVGDMSQTRGQRIWKWRAGMPTWQQVVPATGAAGPADALRFFVDPYRPVLIYVLSTTGMYRSEDGGATWASDQTLQSAITENGAFPLHITTEQGVDNVSLLRDMVFHPANPDWRVAISPAGVFRTFDGRSWDHWLLSSAAAARPNNAVYEPGSRMLYVATSNRGLLRLGPPGAEAEFYTTDGRGGMHLLRLSEGLRRTWDMIVPGDFGGGRTGLFFYDKRAGDGLFFTVDSSGGLHPMGGATGTLRRAWDMIIPGNFGGNGHTDLLFYDAQSGDGEFYTVDGSGNLHTINRHTDWRHTWNMIIPGNFDGDDHTDLLFYDKQAGDGEFSTVDNSGALHTMIVYHGLWRHTWSAIVPGDFGNGNTSLLFYDPSAGQSDQIINI
jgi:hypothetical protein